MIISELILTHITIPVKIITIWFLFTVLHRLWLTIHRFFFFYCTVAFVPSSHHFSVHGNDVSNEGALLHRCDVSISYPITKGCVRAAGHHGAWATVRNEEGHIAHIPINSGTVGYRRDIWWRLRAKKWENRCAFRQIHADNSAETECEWTGSPVSVGELSDVGEPGTGTSNAHRKPLTDSRTFWLSWGKFWRQRSQTEVVY